MRGGGREAVVGEAALDYWPHLEWEAVDDWYELATKLAESLARRRIWLLTKTASRPYTAAIFEKGDILVFGSESAGLPPDLLTQYADKTLRIPMRREVRSLNLSAAAAAIIYEAVRQLRPPIV